MHISKAQKKECQEAIKLGNEILATLDKTLADIDEMLHGRTKKDVLKVAKDLQSKNRKRKATRGKESI